MQAIACDGTISQGASDEILCDGTIVLVEQAVYMTEEIALEFMLGCTILFAIAFGIKLIRKTILGKS